MLKSDFGESFKWGIANSAYQVEGAHNTEGKSESIWDRFTDSRKFNIKGENGKIACDFYNKYETDLSLLREMNFKHFRFSLAWTRILPFGTGERNQEGLDFYHRVIDKCLELGITPWVTVYHWDLPQILEEKGGWTNREMLHWFDEFTDVVSRVYGDKVKNWIVLNEPMTFTAFGYLTGYHAPGRKGFRNFVPAVHHAALCQSSGGRVIRSNIPDANIGSTFSCSVVDPVNEKKKNIKSASKIEAALNRLFIEPALGLGYPIDDLPIIRSIDNHIKDDDHDKLVFDFDFHGIQYYFRVVTKHSIVPPIFTKEIEPERRDVEMNQMNLEVYPEGIVQMIKQFSEYDGIKKLLVTESGVCFEDHLSETGSVQDVKRTKYFEDTLRSMLEIKTECKKLDGYFVWSLTDNFEWSEGFVPRFGLIYIDYNNQKRYIKDSGYWFKEFLSE